MMVDKTSDIRSIALVGHGSTGKTSLTESLLFKSGATTRMGRIADKNTVSDFDVEEKKRQISIDLSVLKTNHLDKEIFLLDTPGYADFVGGLVSGLKAADTACIVLSAVNGVETGTSKAWHMAANANIPRAFVINKVDAEHTRVDEVIEELRNNFGDRVIPVNLPDGEGEAFSKVISVLSEDGNEDYRNELCEAIVEIDEELMDKYLDTMELTDEEFARALGPAMIQGSVFPVFFTAAEKGIGVPEMLDFVAKYFISPDVLPAVSGVDKKGEPVEVVMLPDEPVVAQVFRIQTDPFVGKLAFLRVLRGTVKTGASLYNSSSDSNIKLAHIFSYQGKESTEISSAIAGEIIVVTRVDSLSISSTISHYNNVVVLPKIEFPVPMVSLAIEPKARGDEQKISAAVLRAREEDPTFMSERTTSTNELVIHGMGELHLDIIRSRMKRRFDVEVVSRLPKIAYLESITGKANGHHRHKKQSGGAGQFGEVYIKVEPNERGGGLDFLDEIVGGVIPRQYIPAVEKGIREAMENGIIAGYPVVDVKVHLYDGKYHPVDSKEIAFKVAGRTSFQAAFMAAKPNILEPIYKISIFVPDRCLGDITGDLTSRRGRILGMDTKDGMQVINANVPLSEVQRYSTELRSTTQGEGYYEMEFSHYDVVPSNIAAGIIERAKLAKEEASK